MKPKPVVSPPNPIRREEIPKYYPKTEQYSYEKQIPRNEDLKLEPSIPKPERKSVV